MRENKTEHSMAHHDMCVEKKTREANKKQHRVLSEKLNIYIYYIIVNYTRV